MKIVVLAGGLSSERNVSLSSGTMVTEALRSRGHAVALVDLYMGLENYGDAPEDLFMTDDDYAVFLQQGFKLYANDALRGNPVSVRMFDNYLLLARGMKKPCLKPEKPSALVWAE